MNLFRRSLLLLLLLAPVLVPAQVSLSTDVLNFFTIFTGMPDTIPLTINNNTAQPFVVSDIGVYHTDAFRVEDKSFSVPPFGSYTIDVICDPVQNVRTADWLVVKSSSHPIELSAFVFAFVRHLDPYYDITFDLYHEDLKAALKTLVSFGYTDLGYNPARDQLFMTVDNQAVNGQGASQNTLECVYTGQLAVGYTNRLDCQNNFSFNTEHIFPQSFFGQLQPMRSDIHHLLPGTASANGERSNNPFGVVSNPSWSVGGSKSNGNTFEPRDQSKGDIARAMMYFVIRYQDFSGFMAPQEAILRQWNKQFGPDSVDVARNDAIEVLQKNRNPFIDHPAFCDRIASIATVDSGYKGPIAFHLMDTLPFPVTFVSDTSIGTFVIANQGIEPLVISSISFSDAAFSLRGVYNLSIPKDSSRTFQFNFHPGNDAAPFNATVSFATNDPSASTVTAWLQGQGTTSLSEAAYAQLATAFPNPCDGRFRVRLVQPLGMDGMLSLHDVQGRLVGEWLLEAGQQEIGMDIAGEASGLYVLRFSAPGFRWQQKIILE